MVSNECACAFTAARSAETRLPTSLRRVLVPSTLALLEICGSEALYAQLCEGDDTLPKVLKTQIRISQCC